jgi:hypothetical protein
MRRIRTALVLLLVLAYTGQAVAAVVLPCPKMGRSAAAMDTAGMVHAGHDMASHSAAGKPHATANCCDGSRCNMSHCQVAAALPADPCFDGQLPVARHIQLADSPPPLRVVATLYRPPISR